MRYSSDKLIKVNKPAYGGFSNRDGVSESGSLYVDKELLLSWKMKEILYFRDKHSPNAVKIDLLGSTEAVRKVKIVLKSEFPAMYDYIYVNPKTLPKHLQD